MTTIYRCPVIKLDFKFKSANALESGLRYDDKGVTFSMISSLTNLLLSTSRHPKDVKDYLDSLPTRFHRRVWINAKISCSR